MERVILGLGSNKGDKKSYLKNAVDSLNLILTDIVCSSVYKTSPQDYEAQDDFYNMVVVGQYEGSPNELLFEINEIERQNGREREREILKGPRTLDIDIIFFGDFSFSTPALTIPHPALKKRAFVLVPLLELIPNFHDKNDDTSYSDILFSLKGQRVEKIDTLILT